MLLSISLKERFTKSRIVVQPDAPRQIRVVAIGVSTPAVGCLVCGGGGIERASQVGMQQTVKEMLAGFAAYGEAARHIRA